MFFGIAWLIVNVEQETDVSYNSKRTRKRTKGNGRHASAVKTLIKKQDLHFGITWEDGWFKFPITAMKRCWLWVKFIKKRSNNDRKFSAIGQEKGSLKYIDHFRSSLLIFQQMFRGFGWFTALNHVTYPAGILFNYPNTFCPCSTDRPIKKWLK